MWNSRASHSRMNCLGITTLASNVPHPLFVQAGNEVHVGQKTERTDTDRIFILFVLRPPSLYLAHTLKKRQRRHPAGPRLILAGELRANPVRWLSQSTDKQRENLVMHQRLTMSQVAGTASRRKLQWAHSHKSRIYPNRSYITWLHAAYCYNGLGCFIIVWAIKSSSYKLESRHVSSMM